jgi:arabinose-5-phosphate isomerase
VALGLDSFPVLAPTDLLKTALEQMTAKRLGIVCIVDAAGMLKGVFTDGDIRRHLLSVQRPFSAFFSDDVIEHAQANPIKTSGDTGLREALALMGRLKVWDLPVVDAQGRLQGLLHLHPLVDALFRATEER